MFDEEEESSGNIAEFSMNIAELQNVDRLRQEIQRLLFQLRYNASSTLACLDASKLLYEAILPSLTYKKNAEINKELIAEINALLKRISERSNREFKHAVNYSTRTMGSKGASEELIKDFFKLFHLLNKARTAVGMGMRHTQDIDFEGAFHRAAQ